MDRPRRQTAGSSALLAAFLLLVSCADVTWGIGVLRVEVPAAEGAAAGGPLVEVVRAGNGGTPAWKGDAKGAAAGVSLPPGRYRIFVEDQETGLILVEPEDPGGHALAKGESLVAMPELAGRVDEVRAKDRAERGKLHRGTSVPGELLIRFAPDAGLAARYAFLKELGAEPREKFRGLDLYRVRVSERADLDRLIAAHRGDRRILYIEKNPVVSVPKPQEQ
ncbi:MAG: hypothetical protein HY900_32885 [Deltaproteobacteria bacterium]|nr:hypothetical protein [Deltaproteobacteria bacterium]